MKLPVVSVFKIVKILSSIGFKITRQSGSHMIMRKNKNVVVIPRHKELAKGTIVKYYITKWIKQKRIFRFILIL